MKHIVLTSIALVALTGSVAHAQPIIRTSAVVMSKRLTVRPDSRLWLEGTSNVRDWRCEATTLDASIDVDDSAEHNGAITATRIRGVQVRVPTHALTCGGSQMDHIMYKALHVDDAPDCRQIVGHFDVVSTSPDANSLVMQGTLRIAGRERVVRVPVVFEEQRDGSVRAQGALPILMTDYGISPPTALFGVLRTENRIVVKFDLLVDRPATIASFGDGER
jgi:hypothetical protein